MKNLIYTIAFCLGVLFLGSCEKENLNDYKKDGASCSEFHDDSRASDNGPSDDGGGIIDPDDTGEDEEDSNNTEIEEIGG